MVLMNGSKRARNAQSIINRPTAGGNKKAGLVSKVGHPANVYFRLDKNSPTPGVFPIFTYGSTIKGMVGGIRTYRN
jgi:hypothetical protein